MTSPLDGVDAEGSTSQQEAYTPFPDVSGLRTSATGREEAIDVKLALHIATPEAVAAVEEGHGWPAGTLSAAAWAAQLYHYIPQESTDSQGIAFLAGPKKLLVRLPAAPSAEWSIVELGSIISRQLQSPQLTNASPNLTWITRQEEALLEDHEMTLSIRDASSSYRLRAPGRIHSKESAELLALQHQHLLASFCKGDPRLPALSPGLLPDTLRAGDNPSPRQISLPDDDDVERELFHHQLQRRARESPHAIALDFRVDFSLEAGQGRNTLWTYAELDRRASRLANEIQARRGKGSDEFVVALCLDKSPESYVAQLACLYAGAAWCPIDRGWPEERKTALLAKSGACIVIATRSDKDMTLPTGMTSIVIEDVNWDGPTELSPFPINASALAYKIWTSGTTGLPKAVGIEHKAAVQALRALQDVIPHPDDATQIRYLQFSAYVFDLSILDCFYTWGLGGTLCACPRELLLTDLIGAANAMRVTHSLLTPAVMAMTPRSSIPSLRVVINGGEKLTQVVADTWTQDCTLLNLYGPAEATLIAMHRTVPANDVFKAPNIGVALPTVSCHVLDSHDRVVIKGAVGQLALGGYQCARGYIGDEEKTVAKFKQHPQLGRVYMTGDLVRQLADGSFEYLGREDDQIKINGIRIETLEISAIVRNSHKDVKDSETLAIALGGTEDEQLRIVNFSVVQGGTGGDEVLRTDDEAAQVAHELRAAAQRALPSYMVPSLFVIVSHFPRTSSAKIDRVALKKALAQLDVKAWEASIAQGGEDDAAEDNVETSPRLRTAIAQLCSLREDQIGSTTPFPSLGLDSIKAMILARRLNDAGVAVVSVVDIIEHDSLAKLSRKIRGDAEGSTIGRQERGKKALQEFDARHRVSVAEQLDCGEDEIEAVLPTTPLQQGMLAETLRDASGAAYWLNRLYEVDVKGSEVASKVQELLATVPALRVGFLQSQAAAASAQENDVKDTPFVQVMWRSARQMAHSLTLEDDARADARLVAEAKKATGSDPANGLPPLAMFIAQTPTRTVLLLRIHHALYDARTLELLANRLAPTLSGSDNSNAGTQDIRTALPYIVPFNNSKRQADASHWKDALASFPRGHDVQFPRLGSTVPDADAGKTFSRVGRTASVSWSTLSSAAQSLGTSARPLAQSAWATLLSSYLETQWIMLGDSVSGRTVGPNLDDVWGPLHATVPVPISVDAEQSKRGLVDAVDDFHRKTLPHQHVSLSEVRQALQLSPAASLFQSIFVFEASEERQKASSGLKHVRDLELSVEHPLAIEILLDARGGLELGLFWRSDLMDRAHAEMLLSQYDAALAAFTTELDAAVSSWTTGPSALKLLSITEERPHEAVEAASKEATVEVWLANGAQTHGHLAALEFWDGLEGGTAPHVVSYAQLHQDASRLSQLLTSSLPPQSIVAVCLRRCTYSYVALLATQLSGMAYLPIDENLPEQRQQLLVADSEAACVITETSFAERFAAGPQIFVADDANFSRRLLDVQEPLHLRASPNDLAYILYTSGSTGKPKGCRLTRRNLAVAIEAFRLVYEDAAPGSLDEGVRFLARSAEAFDVALLETFLPLRVGGTIVTAPRSEILQDVGRAMSLTKVTHAAVVPSLFFSQGKRIGPDDLPALRALIVGGEKISQDIIDLWAGSRVPLLNAYGPTEATIGSSIAVISPRSSASNIGRPFHGTQYLVAKPDSDAIVPVLRGEAGELCILGPQVGAGYLGQQDTRAFTTWEGQPVYRTGDLARLTVDNEAMYLGRIGSDSQVKIRGARLELQEVDAAIVKAAKESDLNAVSIVDEDRIVSFVARRSSSRDQTVELESSLQPTAQRIWRELRKSLPAYMVPSVIVAISYLPLASISGKVDAKALRLAWTERLREQHAQLSSAASADTRSLTALESLLVDVLRASLAKPPSRDVTPLDDLFALGLDSLSAIAFVSRLRRRGYDLAVSDLMAHSILEDVAARVERRDGATPQKPSPREEQQAIPCTPLQESLLLQSLASNDGLYVSRISFDLAEGTDIDKVKVAVAAVVERNPIWRTTLIEVEGKFCQKVLPFSSVDWQDWEAPQQLLADIAGKPPARFSLDAGRLTVLAHHALFDGVTIDLFQRDVELAYRGEKLEARLPFSEAAEHIAQIATQETSKAFWLQRLTDYSLTPLPNLTEFASSNGDGLDRCEDEVSSSLSYNELCAAAQNLKVTPQALTIAAFSSLFSQLTGESDSIFGLVLGGRTLAIEGANQIQGPLLSTVPFRTKHLLDDQDVSAHARNVHTSILSTYAHQHTPLARLNQWLDLQDQSLFNTLFSFLPQSSRPDPDSILRPASASMATEYPVAFEVQPSYDGSIALRIVFDPHHVPKEQAALLLKQFDVELVAYAQEINKVQRPAPALLSVIGTMQSVTDDDHNAHFTRQFERHAASSPDATAIDYAANGLDEPFESLTYIELDRLSNSIAALLTDQPAKIVAVYMQRSLLFYASLLAIWKAGKTYLPLDPALPQERLRYMLDIAQVDFILADDSTARQAGELSKEVLILQQQDLAVSPSTLSAPRRLSLSQAAYILFTSGSTGAPKAVSISHRALSAALLSWKSMLPHDRSSRMLQLASPGFDVSLIEICMPLAFGFTIASAPKDVLLEDLEDTFNKLRLTMADLPASLAPTVRPTAVPRLQWLMSGGDAIDERVIADWAPHGLINAWGPTEATIGNTLGLVKAGSKRSIVGKAYPTSSIYVLKPGSTDVAYRGCVGELAVGGPQVAEGYLGRPDLTVEAFITMPDGERVYRTGDRGRVLFDGTVEVLGRVSRGQVKLRGQRLELDEVSHAFRAQEAVADAATLFVQHPTMPAKQLVTWVALVEASGQGNGVEVRTDTAAQFATASILTEVRKRLPSYMVPSHVIVAESGLPLTPNIKIDIRALEKAFAEFDLSLLQLRDAEADRSDSSQWTAEEKQLQQILASINGVTSGASSRTASFYSLGLDSLSAIRLARRIKEAGLGSVAVRDVLRSGNIAGLAAHLSDKTSTSPREDVRVAEARREIDVEAVRLSADDEVTSVFPCTPLQESMIEQSIVEGGRLYWHHHMLKLDRDVSEEKMSSAWAKVVASAEILRMTFHRCASGQGWVQAVHRNAATASKLVCEKAESAAEVWHQLVQQPCPFVLENSFASKPPVRLHLVKTDSGQSAAMLSVHHALYDGNTLPQLFTDLDNALQDVSATQRPPYTQLLPHLLPSKDDVKHWSASLRNFKYRPLKEKASPGGAALEATKRLSLPVAEARSLAQSAAVSLRTVAVMSIAKVLASATQTRDIVLGQIVSLRDAFPGAELVLGPAFNTLPVRVRFAESRMDQMLARVQREADEARVRANASLKDILKDLGSLRAPFDVLVDYQVEEAQDHSWKKLQLASPPAASPSDEAGAVQYPLNIEVRQGVEFFDFNVTADANFFSSEEVHSLLSQLEDVFIDALRHPEQPADAMPASCRALPPPSKQNGALNGVHNGDAAEPDESTWLPLEEELLKHVLALSQAKRPQVSPATSLVSLGFDSISAIRLANLARREGKIKVGVTDVVQGGSIRGIAKLVEARAATAAATNGHAKASSAPLVSKEVSQRVLDRLNLRNDQVDVVLPAIPGQAFHFASWLNSGKRMGGFYSFVWRAEPALDAAKLQMAWSKLCGHHAILRTTFAADEEALYQVVLRQMPACMMHPRQHGDLKSVARDRLRALAHGRAQQSFSSPLARLEVLSSGTQSLLILDLPHALYDAWSLDMLVRDLEAIYDGGKASGGNDYTGFVRHVSAQREDADGCAFWQEQLRDAQPTMLLRKAPPSEQSNIAIFFPRALAVPLHATYALPPLQHLFMASYCSELRHLTGVCRPVFGLYQAGRSLRWPSSDGQGEEEAEKLAAPTMNVLPVQAPEDASDDLRGMAEALRGQLFDRIKWEQSDLGEVCAWAREGIKGLDGSDALFDTYLNVIVQPPAAEGDAARRWQQVSLGDAVDFAPAEEQRYETPIDGAMTRMRDAARKRTLDVDVVVSTGGEEARVDFGIRCDKAIMGEEGLRKMVARMVERVERLLQGEAALK